MAFVESPDRGEHEPGWGSYLVTSCKPNPPLEKVSKKTALKFDCAHLQMGKILKTRLKATGGERIRRGYIPSVREKASGAWMGIGKKGRRKKAKRSRLDSQRKGGIED